MSISKKEYLETFLELEKKFIQSPCVWLQESLAIDEIYNAAERVRAYIGEGFGHMNIHGNAMTGGKRVSRHEDDIPEEKRGYELKLDAIYCEEIGTAGTYEMGKNIITYYRLLPCGFEEGEEFIKIFSSEIEKIQMILREILEIESLINLDNSKSHFVKDD